MTVSFSFHRWVTKFFILLTAVVVAASGFSSAFAQLSDRDYLKDQFRQVATTIDKIALDDTIKLDSGKTHKKIVYALLDSAEKLINDDNSSLTEARQALQNVQLAIVNPRLTQDSAPVPKGDILEDLVPQVIKIAFQVAWVVIFIAFLVSGLFMIFSMESEDRLTKAKSILYYSLIGFAVITMAFAIVKAVTNIDFFSLS